MKEKQWQIRIFGDSIMRGILYDDSSGNYVPLPTDTVQDTLRPSHIHIHNSSCFGYTSTRGMQLLQRAITRGFLSDSALLEYGGNDCDYRWREIAAAPEKSHQPRTPLEEFDRTIRSMITLLKDVRVTPILMTLPPIDPARYLEHLGRSGLNRTAIRHWLGHEDQMYRGQETYSNRIREIAYDTGTRLMDIRGKFLGVQDYGTLLCKDGIHPNIDGHLLIWNTFYDHLKALKSA